MFEAVKAPELAITPRLKFITVDWQLLAFVYRTDKSKYRSSIHIPVKTCFNRALVLRSCLLSTLGLLLRLIGTKKLYRSG